MAEFRLERFKYNWKGDWTSSVAYKRDDVVRVGGKSYVCIIGHVSSNTFATDLDAILPGSVPPQPQPKWTVMTSGTSFAGDWTSGNDYNLGDIVKLGGTLWICSVNHTATTFADDVSYWVEFSSTVFVNSWTANSSYAPGQVVTYNGNLHKCITAHTSGNILEDNDSDWEIYFEGVNWLGEWQSVTEYRVNDLVKYGGTIFRCIETHTSGSLNLDDTKFTAEVFGSQYNSIWDPNTYYNVGDLVSHKGFIYYAVNNNFNSNPFVDSGVSTDWILLSKTYKFVGDWSESQSYYPGEMVLRGGNLYLAQREISAPGEVLIGSGSIQDGSSLDFLDPETWELIVPGKSFKGDWTEGQSYSIGDVVVWKGSTFTCNFSHDASFINAPEDNGSGYEYWDILIQSGRPGGLKEKGDLLTFGLSRQIDNDGSTVYDDSTLGDTRVPIGETEELLSITNDLEAFWRNITEDTDTVFVSTNGIDDDNRGSFQKPFKTIRAAAEYVEDNFTPGNPVIIRVGAGKFEEAGPITVPAGCAINGDELRSTTVVATPAKAEYQDDYQYISEYFLHLESFIADLLQGSDITPTVGNTEPQITELITPVTDTAGNPLFNPDTGEALLQNTYPISNLDGVDRILNYIQDFKNYFEFNTADGQLNPTLRGSNQAATDQNIINAGLALDLNKKWLVAEMVAYLTLQHPTIQFNQEKIKNDLYSLIRGIKKDTAIDDSNYYTLKSAERYTGFTIGGQLKDLFYLRDATGLRDMTTGGLQGVLNPPGVFDLYQKPTGGALVSLDPGWGPEDESTWIVNRSPYIQGVTNTGTGCVGMKVDGDLHNGGNRSMTANDFTQVLSDGIGAWITNNGRAELVSVFTYYCQIGYFAEDGGIIRATNGNNSYGNWGAIADGVDDTEVPQEVKVFNRNNEAQVESVFAGSSTDKIFKFEYSHAGEEYYAASANITGAGGSADVEFSDFRDGGIYQVRLTSPDGSSNAGGGGYFVSQGSAQETADASQTIQISASTDVNSFAEISGMRIIITDGLGVGQYGYVDAYNFATKELTVRRESDGELGWDHIIPGTPLEASLDLTTRYRIEPRVTVPHPGYSQNSYDLITPRTYVDAAYGDFTETFTDVTAGSNILWRDDNTDRVTFRVAISPIQIQVNGFFREDPTVPFTIRGITSGNEAVVQAIEARTDDILELQVDDNGSSFTLGEDLKLILASGSGDTFDNVASPAEFTVVRKGRTYDVTLTSSGSGYEVGNTIIILGTALGGETPKNDLTLTVTEVTDDSTSSIVSFTSSGIGRTERFVLLTDSEFARYSDNGRNFTEVPLPFNGAGEYNTLISGESKFIAVCKNKGQVASSLDGATWSAVDLPITNAWEDGTYGDGKFAIVGSDTDLVLTSADGDTWTTASIPDDTDNSDGSTIAQWSHVAYGAGRFVALSVNDSATATSTDAAVTWTRNNAALPSLTGNIVSIAYGRNRFVAITDESEAIYSFDGITWYTSSQTFSTFKARKLSYAQGLFVVVGRDDSGSGPVGTNLLYTSEDGISWTQRAVGAQLNWDVLTNGFVFDGTTRWLVVASAADTGALEHLDTGARALIRADVSVGKFQNIKIWDPGSGYKTTALPEVTVADPNPTFEATFESRLGNHVLAQPDFINRGTGYRVTTTNVTISGDGYADIIPEENQLVISGVKSVPGPGVQIQITGVEDPLSPVPGTLFSFSGVIITDLGDDGAGNETRLVQIQVSPSLETYLNIAHETEVTLREKFSQCRITGHDFLDIGTGNFEQTNYPELYAGGAFFTAAPENEVYETNQGKIFYTSTDQDGNFRAGELFSVEQATGIVTISAQFFDLDGLSELALGGVRLGGSGASIQEFSSDPTFAADSNNVVPTQRAIARFLSDRLSVGGESLETNKLQAGRIVIGGDENELSIVTDEYLKFPSDVSFDGTYTANDGQGNITTEQVNVSGTIVSQMLFFRQSDDTMQ